MSGSPDRAEILRLLLEEPWEDLRRRAEDVLVREKGRHVFVRGLIEFSNICVRNCHYCGLRSANTSLRRYALPPEEILAAAGEAVRLGADTIVLQSGEGAVDARRLADVVDRIVRDLRVPVTLGVGECPEADYALWKEAGAARFLLKHETADADLYARLHPGYSLKDRIACLRTLRRLGYEAGSGFMVGLPGQRPESLADDILLARDLGVAMCGVGPFLPQAETPLAQAAPGSAALVLRVMAVLRIVLPHANLPATTALATLDPAGGQRDGLLAGGNVLMPSFTPAERRGDYRLYDGKHRVDMAEARRAIEEAGRTHTLNTAALEAES